MINILEDIFMAVYRPMIPYANKINEKWKNRFMSLCFMMILFIFYIARILGESSLYRYYTLGGCILLLLIGFFSLEKELKHMAYNKGVMYSWIFLCLAMAFSDFMIRKRYYNISLVFLLFFTGVFFVWANHSNRVQLWKNFFAGCRYSFWIIVVLSFLFRKRMEGTRYAGVFINPNMFGLLLITIFVVYLIYLDMAIRKGRSMLSCVGLFVEMGIGFFLVYMTQSRTALLSIGVVSILWFVIRYVQYRKQHQALTMMKYLGLMLVIVAVSFPIFYKVLDIVPGAINKQLEYSTDRYYTYENQDTFTKTAFAAENQEESDDVLNRIWDSSKGSSLDEITNGRIVLWKGYAKALNFLGHKKDNLEIGGVNRAHSHNNILQYGYVYGYLGMAGYILLGITTFFASISYFKKNHKISSIALLPLCFVVAYQIAGLTEVLYLPFQNFTAFAFYMVVGELCYQGKLTVKEN